MNSVDVITSLWAKSDAGGAPHSLIGHLMDSGAIAELIWRDYLSSKFRRQLDDVSGGRGRELLVLVAAWHDLGKATPAFQLKAVEIGRPELLAGLNAAGVRPPALSPTFRHWPHALAGAEIARDCLEQHTNEGWSWLLPLIAGHHGTFPRDPHPTAANYRRAHGSPAWRPLQRGLAEAVAHRFDVPLDQWRLTAPSRGVQLALSGLVIMADWIASSDLFPGLGLIDVQADVARERAQKAWRTLGLCSGWRPDVLMYSPADFEGRFSFEPRPLQQMVAEVAFRQPAPGLLIVEAPMGEGKTEAAMAAVELLSRTTGCSGAVVAMPTQGTTDAMYARVVRWMGEVDDTIPVSLLHGKAMLNESFRKKLEGVQVEGITDDDESTDGYGMHDSYTAGSAVSTVSAAAPSSWLLGRHRGLLSPSAVATVDQVLWAATRTKFISLRHAGLAGRVLVIDEVHSYDAYMGVFLAELVRWCARDQVPVILMSATLPSQIRSDLAAAWRQGIGLSDEFTVSVQGYPSVVALGYDGSLSTTTCEPARRDFQVRVETLLCSSVDDVSPLVAAIDSDTSGGGCALVILNTVRRAQEAYCGLIARGVPALLIHGRLTAAERARRTAEALESLGPQGRRPPRLVVVATQIAEQSFDVDADVLYSDLAPMDLLLQRVGRLHRHDRAIRPNKLSTPRVVVAGLAWAKGLPVWPSSFATNLVAMPKADADPLKRVRTVYRPFPLLATAAVLRDPSQWSIPSQVPALVEAAYSTTWNGPEDWAELATVARQQEHDERDAREANAKQYRLDADPGTAQLDLWGLHGRATTAADDGSRPVVRDGEDSVEVCLIRRDAAGYWTLSGRALGPNGERVSDDDLAREVLTDSVRLRWRTGLETLAPLPQWRDNRLLGFVPVLVLDREGNVRIPGWQARYDLILGLVEP
ncbi:MAG: CRISPR-associated helicase Cas3' [Propionibacteriaceae bacterium]